jgi:crotonobetainyl-CoA:carnitine CoA-transferase CaiB-like acyl-CoA transferase
MNALQETAGATALGGLRVVEFGGFAAGPAVGKHLADHGAEVIHVESRKRLDGFRGNYPPYKDNVAGVERAGMFAFTNNDKLSVTLNLKSPEGLAAARRMAARADVIIENFTPGTLARLDLGYEVLAASTPGLVMLSSCNQGQTGPHAGHAGFGTHLTSLSGFTHLTGWPDRAPSLLFGPYIDYVAVGFGTLLVMAGLDQRRRTGRGCHIDLSQYETGLQFMSSAVIDYHASGRIAGRDGNRDPAAAPHGIFPCRGEERWCAISVHDDVEWGRLRELLPDWASAPQLQRAAGRKSKEAEVEARLGEWTREQDRDQLIGRLRAAVVHAAPVNDIADLHADPDLAAMGVWRPVDHPVIGRYMAEGPPYRLSETPAELVAAAPLLGEHNEHVLLELLGYSREEYERLEAAGALE